MSLLTLLEAVCMLEAKHEGTPSPKLNLASLGLDPMQFSPASRDLIAKLPDTPSSRAIVLELVKAGVKQEPKSPWA